MRCGAFKRSKAWPSTNTNTHQHTSTTLSMYSFDSMLLAFMQPHARAYALQVWIVVALSIHAMTHRLSLWHVVRAESRAFSRRSTVHAQNGSSMVRWLCIFLFANIPCRQLHVNVEFEMLARDGSISEWMQNLSKCLPENRCFSPFIVSWRFWRIKSITSSPKCTHFALLSAAHQSTTKIAEQLCNEEKSNGNATEKCARCIKMNAIYL